MFLSTLYLRLKLPLPSNELEPPAEPSQTICSVEEDTESSSKTKHGLVHVEVLSVVVSVGVPEAPATHLDSLTSLFPYHYINCQL